MIPSPSAGLSYDYYKGAPASEKKTRGRFFFKAISAGLTNLPNQARFYIR